MLTLLSQPVVIGVWSPVPTLAPSSLLMVCWDQHTLFGVVPTDVLFAGGCVQPVLWFGEPAVEEDDTHYCKSHLPALLFVHPHHVGSD
jgi:hypothetical protein